MIGTYLAKIGTVLALLAAAAPAATISGSVKDPTGAPVAGIAVLIRSMPAAGAPRTVQTDASGAFRAADLPPGHYLVHISRPGFEVFETEVTAGEGNDTAIEIRLKVA